MDAFVQKVEYYNDKFKKFKRVSFLYKRNAGSCPSLQKSKPRFKIVTCINHLLRIILKDNQNPDILSIKLNKPCIIVTL